MRGNRRSKERSEGGSEVVKGEHGEGNDGRMKGSEGKVKGI